MNVQVLNIPTPASSELAQPKPTGVRFEQELLAAREEVATKDAGGLDPERAKTLRKTAEQLVATTFIMPMLAKMREDPFKSDLFHGGQTEDVFGQRLDTILSERIVSKADFEIVDAVYRSVAERAGLMPRGDSEGVDTHG